MRTTEPLILTSTTETHFWGFGDAKDFRAWLQQARPDLAESVQERLVHAAATFLEMYGETGRRAVHWDIHTLMKWLDRNMGGTDRREVVIAALSLHAACRGLGYELAAVVMGATPAEHGERQLGSPMHPDHLPEEHQEYYALEHLERAINAHLHALQAVEPENATVESATKDIVGNLRPATKVYIAQLIRHEGHTTKSIHHPPSQIRTAEDTVVQALTYRVRTRYEHKR